MEQWKRVLLPIVAGIGRRASVRLDGDVGEGDAAQVYEKDENCTLAIADLQRAIRRQGRELYDVHRVLGGWRVFEEHLIPLITTYRNDVETVMAAAKLMFVLSRPPDPSSRTVSEQMTYLQHYKEALLDSDVIAVFVLLLAETLGVEAELREPISVQRCDLLLWLLRNLLAVPDPAPTDDPQRDPLTRLHDRLLRLLAQEHFLPLFVFVCESLAVTETGGGDQWALLLLEMLFYILRTETPESLMQARLWRQQVREPEPQHHQQAQQQQSHSTAPELAALMERSKREKRVALAALPARHSRWGGKIVLPDGEVGKMMNTEAAVQSRKTGAALPPLKAQTVRGALKLQQAAKKAASQLGDETRAALADMCQQLLAVGYAKLMQAFKLAMARDTRESLNQIDDNDRAKYVWVLSLFTGFHTLLERERLAAVPPATLAAWTSGELDVAERHERPVFYVDAIGTTYHRLDVKFVINSISWFANEHKQRELCYALDAFDRILQTAQLLLVSPDRDNRRIAQSIIKSAYYDFLEDSTRSLHSLIINFKPSTQPFALLKQLIATSHTYLKLLSLTSKTGERVFAKVKTRKRKAKKKTPGVPTALAAGADDDGFVVPDNQQPLPFDFEPTLAADDAAVRDEVEQFLAQRRADGLTGLGAVKAACGKFAPLARGWSAELQQSAVLLIERSTRADDEQQVAERVALVRAELGATKTLAAAAGSAAAAAPEEDDGDDDEDDAEEDDDMRVIQREVSLEDQVRKFAHDHVVQNYCAALRRWRELSAETIHCIVKMFQRLAVDAKMPSLFWQATVLRLFQTLIDEPLVSRADAKFADLLRFIDYVLELLFAKMRDEPEQAGQLALEMLFSRARAVNSLLSGADDEIDNADADHRLHRDGAAAKRNQLRATGVLTVERLVQHRVVRAAAEWSDDENEKLLRYFATFGSTPSAVCDVISSMLDDGAKTAPVVYARLLQLKLLKRDDVPNAAEYEADLFETLDAVEHVVEGSEPTPQLLDAAMAEIVAPPPLDSLEGRDAENGLAILMHRLLSRALAQYRERMGLAPAGTIAADDNADNADEDDEPQAADATTNKKRGGRAAFDPAEAFKWLASQLRAVGRKRADDNETCRESPLYTLNVRTDPEAAKWLLPRAAMRPLLKELHLRAASDDKMAVRVLRGVGGNQLRRFADMLLQCVDDCAAEYERSLTGADEDEEEDDVGVDAPPPVVAADGEQPAAEPRRVAKPKRAKRRMVAFADERVDENDGDGGNDDNDDDERSDEMRAAKRPPPSSSAPLAVFSKSRTDALSELRKLRTKAVVEQFVPLPPSKRSLQRAAAAAAAPPPPPAEEAPVVAVEEPSTSIDAVPQPPVWPIAKTVVTPPASPVAKVASEDGDGEGDNVNSGAAKRRRLKKRAVDSDED